MKVEVDNDLCIGCGTCEALAPEVFKMVGDKAEVKEGADFEKNIEVIKQSIDTCAVNAISLKE